MTKGGIEGKPFLVQNNGEFEMTGLELAGFNSTLSNRSSQWCVFLEWNVVIRWGLALCLVKICSA